MLIIVGIIFLVLFFLSRQIPEAEIRNFIERAGIFGPIVWIFLAIIIYVIAPLTGTPLLLVGFYAFGKITVLYILIVGVIGATINFYIAKRWGRRVVKRFVGEHAMDKIDKLSRQHGKFALFLLRVFQPNLHEFVSYAAGLTSMSYKTYMTITLLAFVPIVLMWLIVANLFDDPFKFTAITIGISFVLSGVFIVGYWIYQKLKRKKLS